MKSTTASLRLIAAEHRVRRPSRAKALFFRGSSPHIPSLKDLAIRFLIHVELFFNPCSQKQAELVFQPSPQRPMPGLCQFPFRSHMYAFSLARHLCCHDSPPYPTFVLPYSGDPYEMYCAMAAC